MQVLFAVAQGLLFPSIHIVNVNAAGQAITSQHSLRNALIYNVTTASAPDSEPGHTLHLQASTQLYRAWLQDAKGANARYKDSVCFNVVTGTVRLGGVDTC